MRFLFFITILCNLYCSEIIQVSRFDDVHKQSIKVQQDDFQKRRLLSYEITTRCRSGGECTRELPPSSLLFLIDIDNTFLTGGRGSETAARLVDTSAIEHIKKWRDAGFNVVFLTSRRADERENTIKDLKAVGVRDEWNIPILITNGQPKGVWLNDPTNAAILHGITTIVHIDDHDSQLDSVGNNVCVGARECRLFHFGTDVFSMAAGARVHSQGVTNFPERIHQFIQEQTESGGTQSTFILKEGETPKFVLKQVADSGARVDQFKEEVLADAIYQAIGEADSEFGIHVPKFQIRRDEGKLSRISEFLPGAELGVQMQADVAKGFVVDAFMANWDLVKDGKNLWLSNGTIYRMDNGGSLRYRALGTLKASKDYDFSSAVSDLYTLRGEKSPLNPSLAASADGVRFYGSLTPLQILGQIVRLVALKDLILKTADECNAWLDIKDYQTLRSNLVTRLNSLKSYYYDQVQPVKRYEQTHPFAVVIPGKSSASILMVADQDGRKKVLLGKRVRHDWWGNFGGKADDGDKTLLNAAVREVREESMGIYHVMADDLVKAPSHDLIRGGSNPDALHRMYLMNVEHKDPTLFMTELGKQTDGHKKEYTDFAWVDVSTLSELVHSHLDTPNDLSNEKQYVLTVDGKEVFIHHPLMDMLRQAPVVEWLESLSKNKKITATNTQGSIGYDVSAAAVPPKVKKLRKLSSSDRIHYETKEEEVPDREYPRPPFFDPRAEELGRIYSLTARHVDLMTGIKNHRRVHSVSSIESIRIHVVSSGTASSGEHSTLLPEQTATDAHLRWSLEQKRVHYVAGNDQLNIFNFLKDVSSLSSSYCEELNPASTPADVAPSSAPVEVGTDFKRILLSAVAEERKMKDWFVFYHALQGKMAFIYDIATEFRNLLRVMESGNDASTSMHSLRALDSFFKDLANVDAFIEDQMRGQRIHNFTKIDNYESTFQEMGLSANTYLFGSPSIDSSSTFDLLHKNASMSPPNYQKFLSHLLSQFGIADTAKYFDLYKRYFGETDENQLLQIFISPEVVNDMVYLAGGRGRGFYATPEEQKEKLATKDFLIQMRTHTADANAKLTSASSGDTLQNLQARIFLKPGIMAEPSKVQIKRHFKVNPKEEYLRELKAMVRADIAQWLQAQYALAPDTLENPSPRGASGDNSPSRPPLQKVYSIMQQAEGIVYETKTAESLYAQFLTADNPDGVRQILAQNPNFDLFKPIQSTDYRTKGKEQVVYPASIIIKKSKIFEMLLNEHLPAIIAWMQQILTSYKEDSKTGLIELLLPLVAALAKKGHAYPEATEAATAAMQDRSYVVQFEALNLLKELVKKGHAYPEATAVARKDIANLGWEVQRNVLEMSKDLVEKGQAFDVATTAATTGMGIMDDSVKSVTIMLLIALVEKGQGVDTAIAAVNMHDGDNLVKLAAYNLFKALFEKGQGFDAVTVTAMAAAYAGMQSRDDLVQVSALNLFKALVENRKADTDIATATAAAGMQSEYESVRLAAFELFRALFEKGQGFKAATTVAKIGIQSRDYWVRSGAVNLFRALLEKGQAYPEATAAVERFKGSDQPPQISELREALRTRVHA